MNLTANSITSFLKNHEIPKSGIKPELEKRIRKKLENGTIKYEELVNYIDEVSPYTKQHIILYRGPEDLVDFWRNYEDGTAVFKNNNLLGFIDANIPLILPEAFSLSSIKYAENTLIIHAVKRIDQWKRKSDYDEIKKMDYENEVELRAYIHLVKRGAVIFTWDLMKNVASLQVLQLPSDIDYEEIENEFKELVKPWLDLSKFDKIDLRSAINKLHELEEDRVPEARTHSFKYQTIGGRLISAQSATPDDSVLGEMNVDKAMKSIRQRGLGRIGNFFWLPLSKTSNGRNILNREIHTIIIGDKGRINFRTDNKKEEIEYVLSRIRDLST